MREPFIRNHQYNQIKKQAGILLNAIRTVADPKVVESVRSGVESTIFELFPDASMDQQQLLGDITKLGTTSEHQQYFVSLEPYLTEFPRILDADELAVQRIHDEKLIRSDIDPAQVRDVTVIDRLVGHLQLLILGE